MMRKVLRRTCTGVQPNRIMTSSRNAHNERVEREFYEDLSEGDAHGDIMEIDYDESSDY